MTAKEEKIELLRRCKTDADSMIVYVKAMTVAIGFPDIEDVGAHLEDDHYEDEEDGLGTAVIHVWRDLVRLSKELETSRCALLGKM